jgi:hypothetical protein
VPAAANASLSGQSMRTTGSRHVDGSSRCTPRSPSADQISSWQARSTSAGSASRTATYPSATNVSISAWLSMLPASHAAESGGQRIKAVSAGGVEAGVGPTREDLRCGSSPN